LIKAAVKPHPDAQSEPNDYEGHRERKYPRISFEKPVTLLAPNVGRLGTAVIENISPGGALLRLDAEEWIHLPLYFFITLTPDGSVRRLCELIWRENRKVGVKFLVPKVKKPKTGGEKKPQRVPKLFVTVK